MALAMPLVWSNHHRLHEPGGEVWVGVRTPGTELPERAERIRAAVEAAGAPVVEAEDAPDDVALRFHDPALVAWLRDAWDLWEEAGLGEDPGQNRVVPYLFAHPGLIGALPLMDPAATTARAGRFAFDTMTLIGPGTWQAARGAVDVALTAVGLVTAGAPAAYACCRPPGHHVTRAAYGGSCYLNNAAVAASRLRAALGGPVAIIDVDAHHGNGAQSIFWERPDVLTGSVHVDPAAGWFPHFLGGAEETGGGTNRNVPLAPGAGDAAWVEAVRSLVQWAAGPAPRALVVALGVDAAAGDPESPLAVTEDGYRAAGRALGSLGLPTVIVQEGGYDLETIGGLVLAALTGFEEGHGLG